jgi:glycosyltransferase involved in cell wall biosynthesis
MKISVLTPAYNCERYIRESIESILNQTYQNWELIIGDDGSSDNTRAIIELYSAKDPRIKCYHFDQNQGLLRMFNHLLNHATGDFMMAHDADDISSPHRMEAQQIIFREHPEIGACGTNGSLFGESVEERIANKEAKEGFVTLDVEDIPFLPATIMWRREVTDKLGGFHLYFDRLSSMDQYWIYLIRENYPVYYLNQQLYRARMHATSNHRTVRMDDMKKLASWDVYKMLRRQREQTGTDALEQNDLDSIAKYIESLRQDRRWMAEKFREYSAIRADTGDTTYALRLGLKAVYKWPWRLYNYRTLLYALRKRLSS